MRQRTACDRCRAGKRRCNARRGLPCGKKKNKRFGEQTYKSQQPRQQEYTSQSYALEGFPGIELPLGYRKLNIPRRDKKDLPSQESETQCPCNTFVPAFAKPFSTIIKPIDMQRLYENGCFNIPSTALQNSLLRTFINYILPSIPVVDSQYVESIINCRKVERGNFSLLLYHSIMFSATRYVNMEDLVNAGFSNRKEAHDVFFERAKILYESQYESDELVVVQSLLLLVYNHDQTDMRECQHWVDVCISVGKRSGLFQRPTDDKILSREQKLLKRVGWACFTQDCLVSLASRRQPRIQKSDFQLEYLKEEDFEALELFELCSEKDLAMHKDLILICVATARLCIYINMVLEIQDNDSNQTKSTEFVGGITSPSSSSSSPQSQSSRPDHTTQILMCDIHLASWVHSLPGSCRNYHPSSSSKKDDPENENIVPFIQRCVLHMTFYATVSVLHQSKGFVSSDGRRIYDAAFQITTLAKAIHARKLTHLLPSSAVTAILVAAIIHISVVQTSSFPQQRRYPAADNLQSCIEAMTGLQEMFPSAKVAISKLTNMVPKATPAKSHYWEDCGFNFMELEPKNYSSFDSSYLIGCEMSKTDMLPVDLRHIFHDEFVDPMMTGLEWSFEDYTTPSTRLLSFTGSY